jgi:NhaP-type Na+/H+ or K+/H+ antiporter
MMIIVGLIIGPYALNLLDQSLLDISSYLRQIALVIILTRSGLNLDFSSLKKMGRPALLMSFVPASLEIIGVTLASYFFLGLTIFEGMLLGSVLAAVSPAVISPRMIHLIEKGYGKEREVPKLILAGASLDDIYVIVLFYGFLGLVETNTFNPLTLLEIPLSIGLGILLGLVVGFILSLILKHTKFTKTVNLIILLSVSLLLVGLEAILAPYVSASSLLGVIVLAMVILFTNKVKAKELASGYNTLWQIFEIILFVLVGASLDLSVALTNLGPGLLVLLIGLLFRTLGVILSISFTAYTFKEKVFIIIAYIPKATVQASIGAIALSRGLVAGSIILSMAVLSILVTAPLGAFLVDTFASKLLKKNEGENAVKEVVSQES